METEQYFGFISTLPIKGPFYDVGETVQFTCEATATTMSISCQWNYNDHGQKQELAYTH